MTVCYQLETVGSLSSARPPLVVMRHVSPPPSSLCFSLLLPLLPPPVRTHSQPPCLRHAPSWHLGAAADGVCWPALPVCQSVCPHCSPLQRLFVGYDSVQHLSGAVGDVIGICGQHVYWHDTLRVCRERNLFLIKVRACSLSIFLCLTASRQTPCKPSASSITSTVVSSLSPTPMP